MVYLIHFDQKYKRVQHYLGYSADEKFSARIHHHEKNQGSRLVRAVNLAGIKWNVVRQWPNEDGNFERKLKNQKNAPKLCPVCITKQILNEAKKTIMCYDKSNNKMFADQKDPVEFLSELHHDMHKAKDRLLQIKELPEFNRIFSNGEKGSIEHMIKKLEARTQGIRELQQHFA